MHTHIAGGCLYQASVALGKPINRISCLRNEELTRGKSESLIAPQSAVLLLLEGLLFTQNFMGCPKIRKETITMDTLIFTICDHFLNQTQLNRVSVKIKVFFYIILVKNFITYITKRSCHTENRSV